MIVVSALVSREAEDSVKPAFRFEQATGSWVGTTGGTEVALLRITTETKVIGQ